MIINSLSLSKSKTVGFITPDGRTKFKKITITASADLDIADNRDESYKEISSFIEKQFKFEEGVK